MDLDADMQMKRTSLQAQPGEEAAALGGACPGFGEWVACAASSTRHQSPHPRKFVPSRGPGFPVSSDALGACGLLRETPLRHLCDMGRGRGMAVGGGERVPREAVRTIGRSQLGWGQEGSAWWPESIAGVADPPTETDADSEE